MPESKSFKALCCVMALVVSIFFSVTVSAAEFSADMTDQQGNELKSIKLYVKGSKYCMEIVEGDEQIIIIVDEQAKKTTIIPVSSKEYREIAINDMMSVMNDPFQGYKYTAAMGGEKSAGAEEINGFECDKYVIVMQDSDAMSKWVSKKLKFPIKIVAHSSPEKVVTLTNIVEGPIDDSKFEIPEGFKKWIDPESLPVDPPDWADGIKSAPVMKPPFEKDMKTGDIVRIKVEPSMSLAVKGISKNDTKAEAKVIPFMDGRPLKIESRYNNFAQKGVICTRQHETPAETDEFVVYVYEGNITATAKWMEMHERTVAAGEEFKLIFQGDDRVETRFVNLSDGESVAVINYLINGQPVSDDKVGPLKYRTVTLKETNEMKKSTRTADGDTMVIKVEKGKMLVKLGQFDTFEF